MGELASYQLSDFILFSQSAYYRLFELYNKAIWPLHILAFMFMLSIVYALWKKAFWSGRIIAVVLFISWIWVAIAFLFQWFYQIHIIANWYAYGYIVQAGLILWYGVIKNRLNAFLENRLRTNIGFGLLSFALLCYPFIALISGRSWMQSELFALTPEPTVLATIAILILYKAPKILYTIPVIWLLLSATTLVVME